MLTSRFFTTDDEKVDTIVYSLPVEWWSRGYEYSWAGQFAENHHVVLDAGCGIDHPFKFILAKTCKYEEGKKYWWHPMGHHVERIPDGIKGKNEFHSDIRLKHYGWIKNKEEKLKRYKEHFEHYKFGYFPHIWNTLLDKNPTLELFEEE